MSETQTSPSKAAKASPAPSTVPTQQLRLWYPKDERGCHIGLTSGHTFVVSGKRDGSAVPKIFRREAIARGCLPVGMDDEDMPTEGFDRKVVIRTAVEQMMNSDEPDAFTRDGLPVLNTVIKKVGFRVERVELLNIWSEIERDEARGTDE